MEANEILRCYGFPVLRNQLVTTKEQAGIASEQVGFPLVMKISSKDILHKSDAGGVKLNIKDKEMALKAYDEIMANAKAYKEDAVIDGILMERMAESATRSSWAPPATRGSGPSACSAWAACSWRRSRTLPSAWPPCGKSPRRFMIKSIKSYKFLQGVRGNPPSDIEAIKDCLLRLSQLVDDHPQIAELDINPLLVYPEGEGCVVADSRIALVKDPNGK